ncbi:TAT-binding protein-like protein 7, AAA ATPase, partial [Coemansia sp. RSA 2708]
SESSSSSGFEESDDSDSSEESTPEGEESEGRKIRKGRAAPLISAPLLSNGRPTKKAPAAKPATPPPNGRSTRKAPAARRSTPRTRTRPQAKDSTDTPPAEEDRGTSQYNLRRRSAAVSYRLPSPMQPPSSGHKRYLQMLTALEKEATEFSAMAELEDAISGNREADVRSSTVANSDEPEPILPINLAELGRERCRRAGYTGDMAFTSGTTKVTFADVGGLDTYVRSLKEMVVLPLLYPDIYGSFGIRPPRGVLFHGAPGTGKTLMARALAQSCAKGSGPTIAFFMRRGADCLSKYVGEAERQLRRLFEAARRFEPSIVFFDELDGLAPARSARQDQVHTSVVTTLLALLDGIDDRGQVVVIGATNRPDSIDSALRRPGRFDREMLFRLPNAEARRRILRIHTRAWRQPLPRELENEVVAHTQSWGGADIGALCTEAVLAAVRRSVPQIYDSAHRLPVDPRRIVVSAADVRTALAAVAPSTTRAAPAGVVALPRPLRPLLSRHETRAVRHLVRALALDSEISVFRPRTAVYGLAGMGVSSVGASIAHALEARDVPVFVISAQTLLSDASQPATAMIASIFSEARRRQPSVVFIPQASQLCDVVGPTTVAFLAQSVHALPMNARVAILCAAEAPVAAVANVANDRIDARDIAMLTHAERLWRAAMPVFARAWFVGAPPTARVCVAIPTAAQRSAFFAPTIELADALDLPPQSQPSEPSMEPVSLLPLTLPPSSPPLADATPSEPADPTPGLFAEAGSQAVRRLQHELLAAVDVLVANKLFRRFANPPTQRNSRAYFDVIKEPMFLTTIALKVRAGKYASVRQFLDDVALAANNAVAYARAPKQRPKSDDSDSEAPTAAAEKTSTHVEDTQRYAEMLQSAAARLVARHHVEDSKDSQDAAAPLADHTARQPEAAPVSDAFSPAAESYLPLTPTSGASDTAPDHDKQPEDPTPTSSARPPPPDDPTSSIPQVVHSSKLIYRPAADLRKRLVADLQKLTCGFSVEALEALRVRLEADVRDSESARVAFKCMHKTLGLWHNDALKTRCEEGMLPDDSVLSDAST